MMMEGTLVVLLMLYLHVTSCRGRSFDRRLLCVPLSSSFILAGVAARVSTNKVGGMPSRWKEVHTYKELWMM
jgi:hypothetical protein